MILALRMRLSKDQHTENGGEGDGARGRRNYIKELLRTLLIHQLHNRAQGIV